MKILSSGSSVSILPISWWWHESDWSGPETSAPNVSHVSPPLQVIALVMDIFTDVDLLCDLMEASNKRRVPIYILLDEKKLDYFTEMCSALDIQNSHLNVGSHFFSIRCSIANTFR